MDPAPAINWLAVFAAAASAFIIGGLWYGPLFGKAWMNANGYSEEDLAKRSMPLVFGVSFLLMLAAAVNLAMFIGPEATMAFVTMAGLAAGLGWVATFLGVIYLFERRPATLWLVNGGYSVVALTLMGAILGAM
ncbi:DUF1761 domain-containing protein [Lentisalinibacter sediminis]|uniref:DUF1761 domain-containing protein n=1 Tax=Lentisalinibacter sediminis TaxID=2992237 RepID=UPI00386A7435